MNSKNLEQQEIEEFIDESNLENWEDWCSVEEWFEQDIFPVPNKVVTFQK